MNGALSALFSPLFISAALHSSPCVASPYIAPRAELFYRGPLNLAVRRMDVFSGFFVGLASFFFSPPCSPLIVISLTA